MLGLAGAGKTTLIRRCWPADFVVSLDGLRREFTGDSGAQDRNPEVVAEGHARLAARCSAGEHTIFDSTATTVERRRATLALASGLPTVAVHLDCPLEVCIARQQQRRPQRQVPVHELERMHAELASATPGQLLDEGFAVALVIRAAGDTYDVEIHQRGDQRL
jgi:predicted kinase